MQLKRDPSAKLGMTEGIRFLPAGKQGRVVALLFRS